MDPDDTLPAALDADVLQAMFDRDPKLKKLMDSLHGKLRADGRARNLQATVRPGQVWEHEHVSRFGAERLVVLVLEGEAREWRPGAVPGLLDFPTMVIAGHGPCPRPEPHRVGWGEAWTRVA